MRIVDCIQGSPEWLAERLGKFTASRMADLTVKSKTAAGRRNYLAELLVERMTGEQIERFVIRDMERGTELEPEARTIYELQTGEMVTEVGFVLHPEFDFAGASPDGLVADTGGVEIKCPTTANHIDALMTGFIPAQYVKQMQWNMRCCEREWWDYVTYDPRLKDQRLVLFRKRVARDDAMIRELDEAVRVAEDELNEMVASMERIANSKKEQTV